MLIYVLILTPLHCSVTCKYLNAEHACAQRPGLLRITPASSHASHCSGEALRRLCCQHAALAAAPVLFAHAVVPYHLSFCTERCFSCARLIPRTANIFSMHSLLFVFSMISGPWWRRAVASLTAWSRCCCCELFKSGAHGSRQCTLEPVLQKCST
jgi:hypothetical protein